MGTQTRAFIERIRPFAVESQEAFGVPVAVTIAQAALESGWGRSRLAREANNLFGVKADRRWQGRYLETMTWEVVNGQRVNVEAKFRIYPNVRESVLDHGRFLQAPRYTRLTRGITCPEAYIRAVHQAGYATDPEYSNKVIRIMRRHRLISRGTGGGQGGTVTGSPLITP